MGFRRLFTLQLIPALLIVGPTSTEPAAAQSVAAPSSAASSGAGAYRVGPRDRLVIRVEELPNLSSDLQVEDDGTILLGVVGSIEVQGLTETQVEERIRERLLEEGMRRATVTATVSEFRSRPVSVLGAVARPGNQVVPGRTTLIDLLLDAGGLTEQAGTKILVRRRADNGLTDQVEIRVDDLFVKGDPRFNLPVYAGDLVHVVPVQEVAIHFLGEVANPGTLTFRDDRQVTLLTAIARAGGLTETASSKLVVKRQDESGKRFEIEVDYRKLLNGKVADMELQDGDLILVKESFF